MKTFKDTYIGIYAFFILVPMFVCLFELVYKSSYYTIIVELIALYNQCMVIKVSIFIQYHFLRSYFWLNSGVYYLIKLSE